MNRGKLLTAYCLSYGNWTVIPHQWAECFGEMEELGFDAVALSFSESEMRYARRTFEMQIAAAHRAGLKVFVVPSRLGGRLAGAPLMSSLWLTANPAAALPENPGVACVESPEFRKWSLEFIRTLMREYDLDGIIWDEPKEADRMTRHPATLAAFGEEYDVECLCRSFAELIGEWTDAAREIRPELIVTLFNMPVTNPLFTRLCSALPGLNYTGFDGGLCLQSYFHEAPTKHKPYLWESWPRTRQEAAEHHCGTFALIENMLLPASQHDIFAENLELFLLSAQPDHLACYYYAHNNEQPETAHRITMEVIRKLYRNTSSKPVKKKEEELQPL
ncbi:MAG: hypothetical protein L6W00_24885 [Lentisphaeria bacterium]|nr:MAG: hypothetical protein L6W00_24885 [Lentisphaeria bacterium]